MNNFISTTNKPPIPTDNFVGREKEINTLIESLGAQDGFHQRAGSTAVISGEYGVGKTELALVIAQRVAQNFPDGQLIISFDNDPQNNLSVPEILETIIHSIDPFALLPDDLGELCNLYSSLLKNKKLLIILDQAIEVENLVLLTPPQRSALLLTSRHSISLPAAFNLELSGLEANDAEKLFATICPKGSKHTLTLAQLCSYHPLAIYLAAGLLINKQSLKLENIITRIESYKSNKLDLLNYLVELAYNQMDVSTQDTLAQLSVFTDSFSLDTATELIDGAGTNTLDLSQQLTFLSKMNLLNYNELTNHYSMHTIVRKFALKHLGDSSNVRFRMADYFANIIEDIVTFSLRGSDGVLLSLLLFDDHKVHIKQSWRWLSIQDIKSRKITTLILKYYKIIEAFGRLRFFPKTELIPQMKKALEAAEHVNDKENIIYISEKLADTYEGLTSP